MMYRVRQFFRGFFAWTEKDDNIFIDRFLNSGERVLFDRLPAHEKRHAQCTAAMIVRDGGSRAQVKAALLHDIGKVNGKVGIIKKSVLVLMDKFFPRWSRRLSESMEMFNIYYNHPEIGASLLEKVGTEPEVVRLVRYHHSEGNKDIAGMEELKRADNSN